MAMRKRMSNSYNKRNYKKYKKRTNKKNLVGTSTRGGRRL